MFISDEPRAIKQECSVCTCPGAIPKEYIVERITDRWMDHIDFDGLLNLDPSAECIFYPACIERIDVKNIAVRYEKRKCKQDVILGLYVCCSILDQRKRCVRRNGYLELNMDAINMREYMYASRMQHLRLAVKIDPADAGYCRVYSENALRIRLCIRLEFILSQPGLICKSPNACKEYGLHKSLYPKPVC